MNGLRGLSSSAPLGSNVAAFDFDGTLTHQETLSRFLLFGLPWTRTLLAFLRIPRAIIQLTRKGWTRSRVKEAVIGLFLRGMDLEIFQIYAKRYAKQKLPSYLDPDRLAILKSYLRCRTPVYLISGSLSAYLRPWAEELGIQAVCAVDLEVDAKGRLTGRLAGLNCWAGEKVRRLRELIPLPTTRLIAFGNALGDRELLAAAWEAHLLPHA